MPAIQNSSKTIQWLGGVGSDDKGDKVKLNHVATALVELADFLITTAERNLDKKGNRATGNTAASMKAVNLQTNATKMSIDVQILSTYKFLNEGVKGVESGSGKYAFKTIYPNKKMAGEIKKWLRVRKIVSKYKAHSSYSDNLQGKNYGATERKNKAIKKLVESADGKLTGLSYAIATNIKKKGIKATYFFSGKNYSAVEATQKEQKKRFAAAFKLDIIEQLKNLPSISN